MSAARGASLAARAERWSGSGLLDVEFYAALRGRSFGTPIEAAEDFVGHGMRERLSPHPFLDVLSLPADVRRDFRQGKVNLVLRHLTGPDGEVRAVGPVATPRDPEAVRTHMIAVAGTLGGQRDRVSATVPQAPVEGRTSVVVLSDDARSTLRAARSAVRHADDQDVEVMVVDRGLPPHVALGLHAWACGQFSGTPGAEDWGWLWTAGATRLAVVDSVIATQLPCSGDVVVFLDASAEVRHGWLTEVRELLADPGVAAVQPLLLQPDDTIAAAGLSATGAPLLVGHPKEDALHLQGRAVPAISDHARAVRAEDVATVQRSTPAHPREFRVAPTSLITSHGAVPVAQQVSASSTAGEGSTDVGWGISMHPAGQLRWSIKLPSPPGRFGDRWGDTDYANSLAASLRRLGQDVVTRRRGAHTAGPTHLDDVSLALRGLHPIPPTPGQYNVLWVISHPEDVDPREFEGYDVVCAASTAWSAEMSVRTGREVVPLLQASEFQRPTDTPATTGAEATVVFVGTNLGKRERPLVWQAVEAGIPLSVYGPGWEGLPQGLWQGAYVTNGQLPELYRRHGIVLADHWPDMARHGFIANRVFDAVAVGAKVISDDVAGLRDVFDWRDVAVARTTAEVSAAFDALRANPSTPPDGPRLLFDDRAQTMLDLVLRL